MNKKEQLDLLLCVGKIQEKIKNFALLSKNENHFWYLNSLQSDLYMQLDFINKLIKKTKQKTI